MINWLYHLTLDISLLIGLVLILRPIIRRKLGANIAYWLWLIPLVRCFAWVKLDRSIVLMEMVTMPESEVLIKIFPNPQAYIVSNSIPYLKIWIIGMIVWLLIRLIAWFKFNFVLSNNSENLSLNNKLIKHLQTKGYHLNVSYCYSNLPGVPFVTGFTRPTVYLPFDFYSKYSMAQQQFILLHELAHLKRKDIWMQLLAELVRTLFWFNPLIHLAWKAFREDQELACDHTVLKSTSSRQRYEYGHALMQGFHAHAFPALTAFYNNHKERFIMLEQHKNSTKNTLLGIVLCAILGFFALTKSPELVAHEDEEATNKVSFVFNNTPLKDVLFLVFDALSKEVVGLNLIPDTLISVEAKNVSAKHFSDTLLKCYDMKLVNEKEYYRIIKSVNMNKGISRKKCVSNQL